MRECLCTLIECFFFNDTATTEIYTLSLHDALPISRANRSNYFGGTRESSAYSGRDYQRGRAGLMCPVPTIFAQDSRSEEHTSELQSQSNLVCRLLLEKKKPPATATVTAATSITSLH